MNRPILRVATVLMAGALLLSVTTAANAETSIENIDTTQAEASNVRERKDYSTTYPTTYEDWENGFMCGNGTMGAIVFGDPLNETTVVNHRRFFIAATRSRRFNDVSEELLTRIRKACAEGDFKTANDLANQAHSWQDGGEGNKHPGYAVKLTVNSSGAVSDYSRTCNYATGEIAVRWHDDGGDWERKTFVSRADNVMVQRLTKPTESTLSCAVSLGTDAGMNFPSGMTFSYETAADCLVIHAVYPNPTQTGHAGYEGVTRVIVKGADAAVRVSGHTLNVTGADEVLLLTRAEKYYSDCETAWSKGEVQSALNMLSDEYDTLLAAQIAVHGELYDRVNLDLNATQEERAKTNEQLLAAQKSSGRLSPALYERLFDAGRFYFLCSAGDIGMPDLLGIWTGDCNVGWSGYYHLDANLNLQMSGAVIGNMTETFTGYQHLMDSWAEGFRKNASDLLGCRGLLGGGNTPGDTSGLISSLNYYYPYQYVTGEMAWLLYPYWEYYEATGDEEFLKTQLYPYLAEMGLFYEDFLKERDADGNYIFAGSISPENQPAGLGLSLVNNSTFDIASCEWLLTHLIRVCDQFGYEQGEGEGVARWQEILDHLPDYRINSDGALAEWSWEGLRDNYNHRHSSGLIGVWPYRDITPETDAELYDAACVTLSKKDAYNYENAGHGLLHAALIAANLKNADSVTQKLLRFGKEDFYYAGLTSSHYVDHGVFCTDVCNTVPTIMMEMLVGSDEAGIEFLPARPTSLDKGAISGMLTRCGVTLDHMAWDADAATVTATLTAATDKTITLTERQGILDVKTAAGVSGFTSGGTTCDVVLKAGESTTVTLQLIKPEPVIKLTEGATAEVSACENATPERAASNLVDGDTSTRWASAQTDSQWVRIDLGRVCDIRRIKLYWEAAYAKRYDVVTSLNGETWTPLYSETDGVGGTEDRDVNATARYVSLILRTRTEIDGQKYGYSLFEVELYGHESALALPGDADGDGKITTTDARLTLQFAAEKIGADALDTAAADVDRDTKITTTDARKILQYAAEKITSFE